MHIVAQYPMTAPMYEKTNEQENINNYQIYAYWLLKEDFIPTCIWCKAFQESKRGISNCEAICTLCILPNSYPFWNWINIICILPFLNYLYLSCTGPAKQHQGEADLDMEIIINKTWNVRPGDTQLTSCTWQRPSRICYSNYQSYNKFS